MLARIEMLSMTSSLCNGSDDTPGARRRELKFHVVRDGAK
jgi:hypothetical protein